MKSLTLNLAELAELNEKESKHGLRLISCKSSSIFFNQNSLKLKRPHAIYYMKPINQNLQQGLQIHNESVVFRHF